MKVLKLFRRYNQVLLMVFMSLLLVAFLIPEAVQGCSRRQMMNEPVGQAFGRTIYQQDLRRANRDLTVLRAVRMAPVEDSVDMFLLAEEARRLGVHASAETGKQLLNEMGISGPALRALADQINGSLNDVYEGAAVLSAISRAYGLQQEAIIASPRRLQVAYQADHEEADVKISVVPTRPFLARVPEPTEEEIAAHFEAHRDRVPAQEEERFAFGYRLPDRVQLEYLTVDPAALMGEIRVSRKEAEEHYQENRSRYVERRPRGPSTQSTQGTQPTTGFETIQLSLDEALDRVKEDVRAIKAADAAQRLMNEIERAAHAPWSSAGLGEDGFLIPPATGQVSFTELRDRFSKQHPVEYHKTALLDAEQLRDLPGIGRARATGTTFRGQTLAELAQRVRGLATAQGGNAARGLNVDEPSPLLMLQQNVAGKTIPYQAFIFRVVQVAPAAPADSLELVRERVVGDLKLQKAHDLAGAHARRISELAGQIGLDAAVVEDQELRAMLAEAEEQARAESGGTLPVDRRYLEALGPFVPARPLTRRSLFVDPKVGIVRSLAERVFASAAGVATSPAARITLVPVADVQQPRWVVVELLAVRPLYQQEFEQQRELLARRAIMSEALAFQRDWFDPHNIRRRAGYVPPSAGD